GPAGQRSLGDNSVNDTFFLEVRCTARVGQSTANASAKAAISQTAGLVTQRLRRIAQNDSKASALRSQTAQVEGTGLLDLSVGRDGAISLDGRENGAAAGYTPSPWGVWANFAWSGINDTTAVAGTQGNVVTGIAGADYEVSDGFIVGGAISIGGAAFDSQIAAFDTDETSIGFNPYLAYQVTDLISLDAILGYSVGVGESTRAETITGHYAIHRYYAAGNASYFQTWERFSLLGSLGVLWGQSFEAAYRESDGTEIGSRRSDLGSVSLLMQPAYLFDLDADNGWYLEPYLVGEYRYDFTISKINGHNNDRDEFRLGLGMNLFAGDSVSGNLEATTAVGREDQRTVSIFGTVRYDF
ncbi:MAG: autotransporter outer membrane beta-barrel domain-containing protein, partial [Pseudomonadota bacterium]